MLVSGRAEGSVDIDKDAGIQCLGFRPTTPASDPDPNVRKGTPI